MLNGTGATVTGQRSRAVRGNGVVRVPADAYWPKSHRPGAMSSPAWAGPHEPGV
jgi:hypothetical protein